MSKGESAMTLASLSLPRVEDSQPFLQTEFCFIG